MKKTNYIKKSNMLVNINSDNLFKITGKNPLQIIIYSDFNNKIETITNIKNEIKRLYPNIQINEIFTNDNIIFTNVNKNLYTNYITEFAIFI